MGFRERDNRQIETESSCKMYNVSLADEDYRKWNFTEADIIGIPILVCEQKIISKLWEHYAKKNYPDMQPTLPKKFKRSKPCKNGKVMVVKLKILAN